MVGGCARATTAAEAKFRIDAPNSQPRNVKVIALDTRSERVAKHLAARQWSRAAFFTASAFTTPRDAQRFSMDGWLKDLAGRTKNLVDEIATADLVVMIAIANGDEYIEDMLTALRA